MFVCYSGPSKSTCLPDQLPKCILGNDKIESAPVSGYYHNESWESFRCQIYHFSLPDMKLCLQNRVVYFFGDSTIRQWFTYLAETFDNTQYGNRYVYNVNYRMGDDMWKDKKHNITMHYHHHGLPNMIKWVNTTDLHYIANMIDELPGNSGTVIFLCMGAHFTISNLEFYRTRLGNIKQAIRRLKTRNKDIPIFVKTANTRDMDLIDESNWFLDEVNSVLREEMLGMDVTIIDVWDMTTCHWTMFHVHPSDEIVKNEIDMAFSYLCS